MSLNKRSYLPRSTIDYAAQRAIYEVAEAKGVSFGKAIEIMLMESKTFNYSINKLSSESPWFEKDVKDFKEELKK